MVSKTRSGLTLVAALAIAAWLPAPASAGSLPTLLTGLRCEGRGCSKVVAVYKVRPHTVVLAEALGGTLVVDWASWTQSSATGSGTTTSSGMGSTTTTQVNVRAWRVERGKFTRLTITSRGATRYSETLHLNTGQGASWTGATALVAHARCAPRGHVYLHTSEVVLWSTQGAAQLYVCVPATGSVHRLEGADPGSSFEDFLAAGHFVSFVQVEGAFFYLDVFDALSGRAVLRRDLGCSGPDGCEGAGASFQLASNGWVALIGQPLRATNGRDETVELDTGPDLQATHQKSWGTDGVSVEQGTGSTLQWSPTGDTSLYSLPLGSSLQALGIKALKSGAVHAASPLPAACSLFTAAEVQAVLGQVSQASPTGACTYTTTTKPTSTLTLTLHPGLTPTEVIGAEHQAFSEVSNSLPGVDVGPPDYNPHLWKAAWDTASGGMSQTSEVRIFANLELTVELVSEDPRNHTDDPVGPSKLWDSDTAAEHAADIAFDRLAGVPISYEHR